MMNTEVLKTEKLCKTFTLGNHKIAAVKDVSLRVDENEVVGLVGESGCGKSTLARLVTRLDTPDSGKIFLCGEDTTHASGRKLRSAYKNMKMIFQDPRSSFDPRLSLGASIRETLKMTFKMHEFEYKAASVRLLSQVGLDESYDGMKPTEVSGGESQRAAIARAIAGNPKLLICDEVT
ncbi:MAG: ATP-binding cassette domain-containing protein, partial [Oscillospiraceae bacterium]